MTRVAGCELRVGGCGLRDAGNTGIEQRDLNAECGMVRQRTDDRR
jgi:hypothetical protein